MSGIKTITVRGRDVGEAIIEAGLHLEGKGRYKVWLWRVPIAPDEEERA